MYEGGAEEAPTVELRLTAGEVEILRTALKNLEAILGREEADELQRVQELLIRLED